MHKVYTKVFMVFIFGNKKPHFMDSFGGLSLIQRFLLELLQNLNQGQIQQIQETRSWPFDLRAFIFCLNTKTLSLVFFDPFFWKGQSKRLNNI